MEKIREIAEIVTRLKSKKIDRPQADVHVPDSQYAKIAKALVSDKIRTEDEVAAIIGVRKSSSGFRMFKKRLKEKLLNSMFFIDLNEENARPYIRATKTCMANCYCIDILMLFSARHAGASLAESTLKKAVEFELFDSALFCAKVLRKQHSYLGDIKQFEHYNALVEQYHRLAYVTDKAAEYLEALNATQANTNILKPDNIARAAENLQLVKELFRQYPVYQVGLHYYRIKAFFECLVQDFNAALQTWKDYEGFLEKYKSYEYDVRLGESALQQLYCQLCVSDYKAGETNASRCENLFKLHSNNWFIYKEYFFLLCMHARNYRQAGETVLQITTASHFKFLNRNRQEKWKIFEAYNYLVHKALDIHDDGLEETKFRLSSFLNETLIYNKDKEGFNTSILIFQAMLLLLEGNFRKLVDKTEALKRYANRYFIKDAIYKSQIFIKMLLIADKCSYDKSLTSQKTIKYFEKLKTSGYAHVNSYDGLEIVPYSDLWEIALDCMKDK